MTVTYIHEDEFTVLSLHYMHIIGLQKWKTEYIDMYYPNITRKFNKIKSIWRHNISNPEFYICKMRLMNEFDALKET